MNSLIDIQSPVSIENSVNSLVTKTLDEFVNHLRSYILLRLYKSKFLIHLFLLGFEGLAEEKVQ